MAFFSTVQESVFTPAEFAALQSQTSFLIERQRELRKQCKEEFASVQVILESEIMKNTQDREMKSVERLKFVSDTLTKQQKSIEEQIDEDVQFLEGQLKDLKKLKYEKDFWKEIELRSAIGETLPDSNQFEEEVSEAASASREQFHAIVERMKKLLTEGRTVSLVIALKSMVLNEDEESLRAEMKAELAEEEAKIQQGLVSETKGDAEDDEGGGAFDDEFGDDDDDDAPPEPKASKASGSDAEEGPGETAEEPAAEENESNGADEAEASDVPEKNDPAEAVEPAPMDGDDNVAEVADEPNDNPAPEGGDNDDGDASKADSPPPGDDAPAAEDVVDDAGAETAAPIVDPPAEE